MLLLDAPRLTDLAFSKSEIIFALYYVCAEDLEVKIESPKVIQKGRSKFYQFD